MTVTAILSVFAGMTIGLRIRVLALVPAMLIAGTAVFAVFACQGDGVVAAFGAAATTVIAIQIGYMCASFAVSLKEPAGSRDVVMPAARRGATTHSATLPR